MAELASGRDPEWLIGSGKAPRLGWHLQLTRRVTCGSYTREAGDLYLGDESGTLTCIDYHGNVAAIAELENPIAGISWSDDGSSGAVILGDQTVVRLNRGLQVEQSLQFDDVCLSVAVTPYGNHLAVSLANGVTQIYSERKRRIARIETARPLAFLKFCVAEPILFGAAEHGLICCHNLSGALIWQKTNMSNVGQMCATGDGGIIYLASFLHGVQAFDGDGIPLGSYVLDGTVKRIDCSYEPQRIVGSSIERSLYWLNSSGEMIWETALPEDVQCVFCDPLGTWATCVLSQGGVYRLNWQGN